MFLASPFSLGKASFTRNARCATNRRSVSSCGFPAVYSVCRVSTNKGRTLSSSNFCPVAFGHFVEFHFPNAMTCGFVTATHWPQIMQTITTIRSHVGKHFASIKADGHNIERCRYDA